MTDTFYKMEERRLKLHVHAYTLLCLILLAAMGFYSYTKWNEYSLATKGAAQNKAFISALRDSVSQEKTELDDKKDGNNQLNKDVEQKLKIIFPTSDDYTALTRQIDAYEQELSTKNNPFEISNIDYRSPIQDENYSILPLQMNIRSSAENFTKFLHLVENSGTLKNKVRLMDISSIKLNFEDSGEGSTGPEIISFSVQINAYFQK